LVLEGLNGLASTAEEGRERTALLLEFPDVDGSLTLNVTRENILVHLEADGECWRESVEIPHG